MRIENNCIIFKSVPEMFHKEKNGLKCNTVRTISMGMYHEAIKRYRYSKEYKEFLVFMQDFNILPDKSIQIVNSVTGESFTRRLTDISSFEDHFIFSWEHDGFIFRKV